MRGASALSRVLGPRASVWLGLTVGGVTFAFYAQGLGRSYDYDSSESVGSFIATGSLLDPFRRQVGFNNHPLFSFLEHVVYSAGGHGAPALRLLPITIAALTVGVVTVWAAGRWGLLTGATAGALLAANPTFAVLSRSVRGYSLLTFAAVASTLLLARLLAAYSRRLMIGYAAVVALGIATHLYALLFLVSQIAVVVARRKADRAWLWAWAGALLVGLSVYAGLVARMLTTATREHGVFRPWLPLDTAAALLGTGSVATAVLALLLLAGGVWLRRPEILVGSAAIALVSGVVWLGAPRDLYPRFFVWLVPAVALLAAIPVRRSRFALLLAGVALAAMLRVDTRFWTTNPVPSAQAAVLVERARTRGERVCVLPDIRGALMAYTTAPTEASNAGRLRACDIVLGAALDPRGLLSDARRTHPYRWSLPAETPYIVYSRRPRSDLWRLQAVASAHARISFPDRRPLS